MLFAYVGINKGNISYITDLGATPCLICFIDLSYLLIIC